MLRPRKVGLKLAYSGQRGYTSPVTDVQLRLLELCEGAAEKISKIRLHDDGVAAGSAPSVLRGKRAAFAERPVSRPTSALRQKRTFRWVLFTQVQV
jgi:hypothetical protein